ncbi:ATP-dependent dethiobiotin synthetase BioD [Thiomicrorhabdus immobilis]|uniref:ATP-dependent dethiobiotin synthetase BioD n=1 Tax=Thiomicrorhabdus immobilis TaxID=2791037 RepID=A0ABN6CVF5_9GAMM|nr:dethiobiotin synthase [Thiomicrorhabdus immobilis]BCN92529.1 ATP-dependent dethiobiotin synthetase BioD [Thiomicrorhabdus immobilis]
MNDSPNKTTRPGGFFITGTDTDVGKTYIAGCVAHTLIQQGYRVTPRKPIASGCIKQADGSLLCEDALFLQQSCQSNESLQSICPNQFEPPISPQTAIQQAGLVISTVDLVQACQPAQTLQANEILMVEGAGGFYSPLCSDGLNKDLATALDLPVILVVKNQLGCINHTLLTLAAIEQAGLQTHAIILNFSAEKNHAKDLDKWTTLPIFHIPFSPSKTLIEIPGFI